MASPIDQLIVEIRAETASLRKGLNDVNKRLGTANKTAKSSMITFSNLSKVFAAIGLAKLGSNVIGTTRTFEDLDATLRAITGSAKAADASFALIRKFTATTTFQLENVTEGFITLFNAGIEPSARNLTAFGNVAAAFNKDITQISRAIFNATTGEMEMLKQFGIKAKQNQDTIDVTFKGTTTTIEKSAEAITEFVRDIGETVFPTALQERAETLSGAISNMQDSFSEFFFAIGEGGLKDVMTELALSTKSMLDSARPLANQVGGALKIAFEKTKEAVALLKENFDKLIVAIAIFTALNVAVKMTQLAIAAVKAAKALRSVGLAVFLLNSRLLKNKAVLALVTAVMLGIGTSSDILGKQFDELAENIINLTGQLGELVGINFENFDDGGKSLESLDTELNKLLGDFKKGESSLDDFNKVLELAEGNIKALELVYEGLGAAVSNGKITQEEATQKLREFLETTGPVGKAMAQIGNEVDGLASSFSDDLTNALMNGENALESFRSFAQNVVQAVISSFMEMLVIQPIVDAILGAFNISSNKGRVGSVGGSSGGGGVPTRNAGGGSVYGNVPTIVGERGPELFVPHTNGNILNNMNTKNAMGGGATTVINQSINFATGVVPTVRAEVTKMLPQIAEVTKGAVQESAMRGGSFRRSLVGG